MTETNYNLEMKKEFERLEELKRRLLQASQLNMNPQIIQQIQYAMSESSFRLEELQMLAANADKKEDDNDGGLIIGE